MKRFLVFGVAALALSLVGCSSGSDETGEGSPTGSTKPAESKQTVVGDYGMFITPEMKADFDKNLEAGRASLADLEKAAATSAEAKQQYEMLKAQLEGAEKMMEDMVSKITLTLNADKTAKMTSPQQPTSPTEPPMGVDTYEGNWEDVGDNKVKVTMKTKNGKPDPDIDREPSVEMTFDPAEGTLTGTRQGQEMTFKKK
jgi:uncharacterized lipoprotein NlpE involved in copper resistance